MKRPADLKAVIFDLDGTLVDTAEEFVTVVQALRAEHNRPAMEPGRIRASVSSGARALVSLALDLPESAPEFETNRLRLLTLYSEVLGSKAKPYPGIEELLAALTERDIRWGVATNKPRAYTDPLLASLGLAPDSIVCPDDVRQRKPHPESLYKNCLELNCAPHQAIYTGDHLRDIQAGRNAGMYTIAATYGYIEPGDDPSAWGADASVTSSTQLATMILPD